MNDETGAAVDFLENVGIAVAVGVGWETLFSPPSFDVIGSLDVAFIA